MTVGDLFVDGKRLSLGRRIGKGGEGEVFELAGSPGIAVKVYVGVDPRSREQKIDAMVTAGLSQKTTLVAFPTALIRNRSGAFIGFLMRLVSGHRPLHDIYSPGSRKHNFPKADFRFLVRTAANVARSVASVHAAGCIIGDINHSSILVSGDATVALIDADSFQFKSRNQTFNCLVGVPEYTPPELQGIQLGSVVRTPNHDAFGLAIVVFQLLFMGRHPFIGTIRRGELPPLHESIRDYRFVYTENRNVGMDQPPGTPVLSDYSAEVATAFERAFAKEFAGNRPTAAEWVAILAALESSLIRCAKDPLHYYGRVASDCPWCEMEEQLGTVLFLPFVSGAAAPESVFDPGANAFNLDAIWSQIQSTKIPTREQLRPSLAAFSPSPSADAVALGSQKKAIPWPRIIGFAVAVLILIAAPAAWPLWLGLGAWAIFSNTPQKQIDTTVQRNRYVTAEQRWRVALDAWYKSMGLSDAEALKSAAKEAVDAYRVLPAQHKAKLDAYKQVRRDKQLAAFLDGFEIRNAKLRGIGPAKQAALASYGIETAADVSIQKVLAVPGFGDATAGVLIEWKRKQEARFVYQPAMNDVDRNEINRIVTATNASASNLRTSILSSKAKLLNLAARISSARSTADQTLNRIHQELEQAKCDLTFLAVPLPTVAVPSVSGAPSPTIRPVSPASSIGSSGTYGGVPSCPRCGSSMARRVARRGSNAGGSFWGCSRYPRCKGTRNI